MAQAIALAPDMSQRIMDNAMNIGTDRAFVMGRTGVYMENRDSFEVAKDIIPSYDRDREDSKSISELLQVSMDSLVRGDRKYVPETRYDAQQLRLLAYYRKMYVA